MCRFLSAIVKKNGDILCNPEVTDSHSTLAMMHGLPDNTDSGYINCARVEFAPNLNSELDDLSAYRLHVDERVIPEWWSSKKVEPIIENLRNRVTNMIKYGSKPVIVGGAAIVPNKREIIATISDVRIPYIGGPSRIVSIEGRTQIKTLECVRIDSIHGEAVVDMLRGDSRLSRLAAQAHIYTVEGGVRVENMYGQSKISDLWGELLDFDSGYVLNHYGRIHRMKHHASISNSRGVVLEMQDYAHIRSMDGIVISMRGRAVVQELRFKGRVEERNEASCVIS